MGLKEKALSLLNKNRKKLQLTSMQKNLINKIEKILICPYCQSSLRVIKASPNSKSAILKCKCDFYPVIENIVYLNKKSSINKKLVYWIGKNKFKKALLSLISFNRASFLFFKLTSGNDGFYRSLGFNRFLNVLKFCGYPDGFADYLKQRSAIPSFYVSLTGLSLIANPQKKVVELGCGTGNLAPYVYQWLRPENYLCFDTCFLTLYMARLFFIRPTSQVVCADLEEGIPLKNNSVDVVQLTDIFHCIHRQDLFLSELNRILARGGRAAIIHNVNKQSGTEGLGISVEKMSKLIKNTKKQFTDVIFLPHRSILSKVSAGNKVDLRNEVIESKDHAYNVFLSKSHLPKNIYLKKGYRKKMVQLSKSPYGNNKYSSFI